MIKTGLVSITFRQLTVEKIIELVSEAGLDGIEWGGDIHVPHGNLQKAREVARMTNEAGLDVAAYGSYYRVGCGNEEVGSFEDVLETAVVLGAPLVRVWAGNQGSAEADDVWWDRVVNESRKIATIAEKEGIKIAYEYHGGTLTDTDQSAIKLLTDVDHSNIYTYWQPPHNQDVQERKNSIKGILSWLKNIHVFYWTENPERVKHPLHKAKENWKDYLSIAAETGREHYAMLEFVKNDDREQFLQDAEILKDIVKDI